MKIEKEKKREIIIVRRGGNEENEENNGGVWKIEYEELMKEMMDFLMVMWIINDENEEKKEEVERYLNKVKIMERN